MFSRLYQRNRLCRRAHQISVTSKDCQCLPFSSNSDDQNNQAISLLGRDLLSVKHLKADDIKQIIWTAIDLKSRIKQNEEIFKPLEGKAFATVSNKTCLHTKELLPVKLGIGKLGGCSVSVEPVDISTPEDAKDIARELSGMSDCILTSGLGHDSVRIMADESKAPVVSGGTDMEQPLQTLAYLLTIQEHFNHLMGCRVAWIGNGNHVLNSLMYGCSKLGLDLSIATPAGQEPNADIMLEAMKIAGNKNVSLKYSNNPVEAVYRADVIITDPWISSTQDANATGHLDLDNFKGFNLNRKMLKEAGGSWVLFHRLPRHCGEVSDDIFYGDESLVWRAAENMMWVSMALLVNVLLPYTPTTPMPKFVRGK